MPSDERTYIRLHDGMPESPKVDGLSDKAFRTLIELWCWCSRNLTDGAVPEAVWRKRTTPRVRSELLAVGLIDAAEDGVVMHDYLEHQRSRAQVQSILVSRRSSAAMTNHQRWHVDRGIVDVNCDICAPGGEPEDGTEPADEVDPGSQDRSVNRSQDRSVQGRSPIRSASPETETQLDLSSADAEEMKFSSHAVAEAEPKREDVEAICGRLAERMVSNGCKRPAVTKAWRDEARRLIDIDGREIGEVMRVIDWCQADGFWKSNIQSTRKLREKYDQLRLKAKAEYEQRQAPQRPNGRPTHTDRALQIMQLASGMDLEARGMKEIGA